MTTLELARAQPAADDLPETNIAPDYRIKRIRIFHPYLDLERTYAHKHAGTVIGLNKPAFDDMRGGYTLRLFLEKWGMFAHKLGEDLELPDTFSVAQYEVKPILKPEQLAQFGQLCVSGGVVSEWAPELIDVQRDGVVVSDHRFYWPKTEVDSGPYIIASSLLHTQSAAA